MEKVISRAYNSFKINDFTQAIVKTSRESRLLDEVNYYRNTPTVIKNYFPKLLFSDVRDIGGAGEVDMGLEYYAYPNLAERWFEGNCDFGKVATKLKGVLDIFSQIPGPETNPTYNRAMFIDKTWTEYEKLIFSTPFFDNLPNSFYINKKEYYDFPIIWGTIKEKIQKELLDTPTNNFIHGDLCFSNILYGEHNGNSVIKLIDPRGSYGAKGCFGNRLYDLAKLLHSFEGGYEYIIYNKFHVKPTKNSIDFEFQGWNDVAGHFDILFNSEDEKRNARLIQGLIYLGMCKRQEESLDRQMVMYCRGIQLLNEFI